VSFIRGLFWLRWIVMSGMWVNYKEFRMTVPITT
jgi:hypothetical protein